MMKRLRRRHSGAANTAQPGSSADNVGNTSSAPTANNAYEDPRLLLKLSA